MRQEVVDKSTGAILFKESEETKKIRKLLGRIEELEKRITALEKKSQN